MRATAYSASMGEPIFEPVGAFMLVRRDHNFVNFHDDSSDPLEWNCVGCALPAVAASKQARSSRTFIFGLRPNSLFVCVHVLAADVEDYPLILTCVMRTSPDEVKFLHDVRGGARCVMAAACYVRDTRQEAVVFIVSCFCCWCY